MKRRDSIKLLLAAGAAPNLAVSSSEAATGGSRAARGGRRYQERLKKFGPAAGCWGRHPNVIAEYIELPGYQEPHTPPEFNNIYFMRYRYDTGAATPGPVKAIVIDQMGGGAASSSHCELAAQVVDVGRGDIEFWVVSRRQVGLEDTMGIRLALDARKSAVGRDYYFGPSAGFRPLQNRDVPFMAYWGLEVAMRDLECILNLVPEERRATNVFMAGHSLGGYLTHDFAGYQFPDGKAGYEKVAGIVIIDGGPAIGMSGEDTLDGWKGMVQDLIDARPPKVGTFNDLRTPPPSDHIKLMLQGMDGFWDPDGESPDKFTTRETYRSGKPLGGDEAVELFKNLRLTNEALIGMKFDDDGIPGSMCNDAFKHVQNLRCGRLDFPVLTKPGVPPLSSINRNKVYGWLSGGAGKPGGETDDGPLSCYPTCEQPWWWRNPPNPNPVRSDAVCLTRFFTGERTNVKKPLKYKFPISGEIEIYRGSATSRLWYGDTRPLLDTIQANGMYSPELNVTRKKDINIPVLVYGGDGTSVPGNLPIFPQVTMDQFALNSKVTDWTIINARRVKYSGSAKERTTFPDGTSTRLYSHGCYSVADNALGGKVAPGAVGAHVITNTLVPWILARGRGTTTVPTPASLGLT